MHPTYDHFPRIPRHAPPPNTSHSPARPRASRVGRPRRGRQAQGPVRLLRDRAQQLPGGRSLGRRARRADGAHGPQRGRVGALHVLLEHGPSQPAGATTSAPTTASSAQRRATASEVLPIVLSTPRWASSRPLSPRSYLYAPQVLQHLRERSCGPWSAATGPRGSFWRTSGTPKVSIRSWQIWNEPAADFFWATRPWPPLLHAHAQAGLPGDQACRPRRDGRAGQPRRRNAQLALAADPGALQVGSAKVLRRRLAALLLVGPVGADHGQADAGDRQPDPAARCAARRTARSRSGSPSSPGPPRRARSRAATCWASRPPPGPGGAPERGVQPPRA